MDVLFLVSVAVGSFLSTSLDSLTFLVPALSGKASRRTAVVAGYLGALVLVVGVSWGVGALGETYLPVTTGWLGLIPLGMGLTMLARSAVRRWSGGQRPGATGVGPEGAPAMVGVWGTGLVTLSLSGDNLGVFIPLFADTDLSGDIVVSGTLVLCAVLWSGLALGLTARPGVRALADRWAPRLMPLIMIAVGLFILADTARDLQ